MLDLVTVGAVGLGGLLVILGWELVRTVLLPAFVLIMCRSRGKPTGRYPTLAQAAEALHTVGPPASVSRRNGLGANRVRARRARSGTTILAPLRRGPN